MGLLAQAGRTLLPAFAFQLLRSERLKRVTPAGPSSVVTPAAVPSCSSTCRLKLFVPFLHLSHAVKPANAPRSVPRAFYLRYCLAMLTESFESIGSLQTALELHKKSLRLVPLLGKSAIVKDWPNLHLGESDIRDWSRRGI